jgi:phosphotransferase system enzyme I (PtsP)
MFAHDRGWVRKLEEAIRNGLTAEAAVEKVQSDTRARMIHLTDPYLRERLHDFDDLANRLLRQLTGYSASSFQERFPEDAIIVARAMGAAELLDYTRPNIRGLVLEDGTPTSHVVIVARAMNIPVVGQVPGVVSLAENGDPIIVDGEEGRVHLRPMPDLEAAYAGKVRFRAKRQEQFRSLRSVPSETRDGQKIALMMNAGLLVDLPQLDESGAEGIGLFRTELQFMIASKMPRMDEQEAFYSSVLAQAGSRPVTFRTLDIGGDKVVPYFRKTEEENPALGWRAVRLAIDRPGLLKIQLRALLKAAAGCELRLMVPMVTEVQELHIVRDHLDKQIAHLGRFGYELPTAIRFGAMLEVPNLLWQLDELMEAVDFVSVGSNDLFQFTMAADRGNGRVSGRFDILSRPFLRLLRQVVLAARRSNTHLTLCGEMAGRPLSAMALLGLGFRSISMSAAAIGPVKSMVLSLDLAELENAMLEALEETKADGSMRAFLADYAAEKHIAL